MVRIMRAAWIAVVFLLAGCSTSYIEVKGECVMQQWQLLGQTMRERTICDLPPPEEGEENVRDREAMDVNPFPDLFEENKADTTDPDLLEDSMGYPQSDED